MKKKREKEKRQTFKDRKEQGGTEAIVKGWEINDFVVHLGLVLYSWYVKFL